MKRALSFIILLAAAAVCYASSSSLRDARGVIQVNAPASPQEENDSLSVQKDTLILYNGISYKASDIFTIADSLHYAYDFEMADSLLTKALEASSDSLARLIISDELSLVKNGLAMRDYCSQPNVVAKQRFALRDFFLFYPLQDRSWRENPNQLDTLKDNRFVSASYLPEGASPMVWSATDSTGTREIYTSEWADSVWTLPKAISDRMVSSDEIYPMLSADGKTLYFASDGLFGMGGFDIYQSEWDEQNACWGTPSNLGFPYSSPADDFLYCNTSDGRYTIFASNRECSIDSVYIYVLEFDSMPLHKEISDPAELSKLCRLIPDDLSRIDNGAAVANQLTENPETQQYANKVAEVRQLRDSLYSLNKELDALRSEANDAQNLAELKSKILEKEMALPTLQAAVDAAVKELHNIEMEFLSSGMLIDTDMMKEEAQREVVGADAGYTFTKNTMGRPLTFKFETPPAEIPEETEELP